MSESRQSYRFQDYLQNCKARIDSALELHMGDFKSPYADADASDAYLHKLRDAIRYSLLNNGKRIRPLLVYAAARAVNQQHQDDPSDLDKIAAAVEMLHSYSLIHDDLPAMDDDELRRGQATCHIVFGEASAILAGDALNTRAFEVLTELENTDPSVQLRLVRTLAAAAGQRGMVGGQAIDLEAVGQAIDLDQLETIHRLKTGALIRAAIAMGAIYAGANPHQLESLDNYAESVGLAFQVQDDILDIESDTATLGKSQGSDLAQDKPTYPSLLGIEGAKAKAGELHTLAVVSLEGFGERAQVLRDLSAFIISRRY